LEVELCIAQRRQAKATPKKEKLKKIGSHKSHVQTSKKLIFDPFRRLLLLAAIYSPKAKGIMTRVGFEPTPFRTSVLEEP
jgi:hypothetical protein